MYIIFTTGKGSDYKHTCIKHLHFCILYLQVCMSESILYLHHVYYIYMRQVYYIYILCILYLQLAAVTFCSLKVYYIYNSKSILYLHIFSRPFSKKDRILLAEKRNLLKDIIYVL